VIEECFEQAFNNISVEFILKELKKDRYGINVTVDDYECHCLWEMLLYLKKNIFKSMLTMVPRRRVTSTDYFVVCRSELDVIWQWIKTG